jgi:cytochrome b involved in lipid metabolism
MTAYAPTHPGGAAIITNLCGTDATSMFATFHKESLLATVPTAHLGVIQGSSKDPC